MRGNRTLGVVAIAALLVTVLSVGVWAATGPADRAPWRNGPMGGSSSGFGAMMGARGGSSGFGTTMMLGGMMGGQMMGGTPYGIRGTGEVTTLDQARAAAERYAATLDLNVGEVMQFTRNFYAELTTASGDKATEVLIDPATGAVYLEFGPAMMWNTKYGMHSWGGDSAAQVSPEEAQQIADRWLAQHQPGSTTEEPDVFPGYYTLHVLEDGTVTGMLSVNAVTGVLWFHTWHGEFVAMSE
jgi:hypothetical protein